MERRNLDIRGLSMSMSRFTEHGSNSDGMYILMNRQFGFSSDTIMLVIDR